MYTKIIFKSLYRIQPIIFNKAMNIIMNSKYSKYYNKFKLNYQPTLIYMIIIKKLFYF